MSGTRVSAAERRERDALRTGAEQGDARPGAATRFKPGQSGNPGGRPRGLAATVKSRTTPDEILDGFLGVARDPKAKASERLAAWREIADRGYGKSPAFAAIEGSDPLELGAIAQEIQGIADELAARRQAPVSDPAKTAEG